MPPINQNNLLKNEKSERSKDRKKRKEQKLLKAAAEFKNRLLEPRLSSPFRSTEEVKDNSLNPNCEDSKTIPDHSYTISIAVPGSILDNAQSQELRTYLAGQIARAACIFCVNEIIVYDDGGTPNDNGILKPGGNSCAQLARLLQYLECPQYLRKLVFPLHKDLQYAGVLNPLDAPHHLRQTDDFPFREGIVTHHSVKQGKGSHVNVGLLREVTIDKTLTPGIRVTVRMLPHKEGSKKRYGQVVSPDEPRKELGVYWGYNVRLANSLSNVFAQAPYKEGYDLTIGTSDKGTPICECSHDDFSNYNHILIAFGGLSGLEAALESDENLTINDVSLLFDKYLNTCPNQGSRTIRTEEAILISLAEIISKVKSKTN